MYQISKIFCKLLKILNDPKCLFLSTNKNQFLTLKEYEYKNKCMEHFYRKPKSSNSVILKK